MLIQLRSEPTAPRRVVLFGASGFLARHLQTGLRTRRIESLAISSLDADLTESSSVTRLQELVREDDSVVMLSTLTPDKGRDHRTMMKNLGMAETVCRVFEDVRCAHFVYLSSDAVYDAHQTPLDENSSREPIDLYALMHTAREMMIGSVLDKAGIPFCILRPTNMYGFGDTHNSYGPNRFVRSAVREGCISLFGDGEECRSHVYVLDAVDVILRVLLHQSTGTLNVAANDVVSFRHIADLIVGLCRDRVRIKHVPPADHANSSVVHRPYAVSAMFKAFPDIRFTAMNEALASYIEAVRAGVAGEGGPAIERAGGNVRR